MICFKLWTSNICSTNVRSQCPCWDNSGFLLYWCSCSIYWI